MFYKNLLRLNLAIYTVMKRRDSKNQNLTEYNNRYDYNQDDDLIENFALMFLLVIMPFALICLTFSIKWLLSEFGDQYDKKKKKQKEIDDFVSLLII